jgi:hypothetical protein
MGHKYLEVMRLKGEGRQLVPRAYNRPLLNRIGRDAVPNTATLPEVLEHEGPRMIDLLPRLIDTCCM